MTGPKISYGTEKGLGESIHPKAQYLLMEAGIINRTYPRQEFIEMINSVSLEGVKEENYCRRDVEIQRQELTDIPEWVDSVTIQDFKPDREYLERVVNSTIEEMHEMWCSE